MSARSKFAAVKFTRSKFDARRSAPAKTARLKSTLLKSFQHKFDSVRSVFLSTVPFSSERPKNVRGNVKLLRSTSAPNNIRKMLTRGVSSSHRGIRGGIEGIAPLSSTSGYIRRNDSS